MKKILQLIAPLLFQLAISMQAGEMQVLRGHVPVAVRGLVPVGQPSSSNELNLAIGLPLRNTDLLTDLLKRLYDPAGPDFHHFLTADQFTDRFGPTEADYQTVVAFAKTHRLRVTGTHANRTLLDVTGKIADIENTLHGKIRSYKHPRENRTFYALDTEPSLDLPTPVLHISGLDNYVLPRPMSLRRTPKVANLTGFSPADGSGPGGTYMGTDFRTAYVPGLALTGSGQSVGLFELDGFFPSDVAAYVRQASLPPIPVKTILLDEFAGPPGGGNIEVSLDISMAMSLAPGLDSVLVYEGLVPDDVLNRMATDNIARQLSASWLYGIDASTEQIFQQFAAQGQSFFNAAGDSDAWVDGVPTPADDPYITIVGGTTLTTAKDGEWSSETAWNWGNEFGTNYDGVGTGGGISATYPIPAWQEGISMATNAGSTTMRNLPDVSMIADNVFVFADGGSSDTVGGTSIATPLWAAFMALVNQQAAANGQAPLGFINPTIYALGAGSNYGPCFHDITTGNNSWSQSPTLFSAVSGYDLCTGWGTPTGSNLVNSLAPPDALQVFPQTAFVSVGGVGGPFNVMSGNYLLTNGSAGPVDWATAASASWLTLEPSTGTLAQKSSAATVTASLNIAARNLPLGTYSATVWFTNLNDGAVLTRQFVLSIIKPPAISVQPTNQLALGGGTATFTATAQGGLPLVFQWQHNGTNLSDDGHISGSQMTLSNGGNFYGSSATVLTLSNVAPSDVGIYALVASNFAGVAASSNALLIVPASAPAIIQQPASQTAIVGTTAEFTVGALGDAPLTYRWQDNGTNLSDGPEISGSASATLVLSNVSAANIGTYTVVIGNTLGYTVSTGAVLTVEVTPAGAQLVQNGGFETGNFSSWNESGTIIDCSVGSGFPAVHTDNYGALLGSSGSLGYLFQIVPTSPGETCMLSLWLDSPDGLGPNEFLVAWNGNVLFDQTNIAGIGWTNLQFRVTSASTNTVLQFGFRDDQSFLGLDDIAVTPLLSANGAPVIATQPETPNVALAGGTNTFSVFAAGQTPLSYQWQFNGTNISGGTNPELVLGNLTTNQSGTYTVVVSNSIGSTTSSNALLFVFTGAPIFATFDDLLGDNSNMPDPYDNLTWSNFFCINGITAPGPGGYNVGVVSPSNVIYNGYGTPAAITSPIPFDLLSAYLTAGWNNGLRVEAKGYSGSNLVYDNSYVLSATAPTLISFNYSGLTTVQFISSGGSVNPGYKGAGTQFTMDNVTLVLPPSLPVVLTQPANITAIVNGNATFAVTAVGPPPLTYYWRRNGSIIPGATASSYTLTKVQLSDSGSRFRCFVTNSSGIAHSDLATLTVINPPGSSILSQGNLVVTITNYGGRISSLLFKGIELYRVGTAISDWGLQTGTDGSTFVRNEANTDTIGQPMSLVFSNKTFASYAGVYTAGGANVAVGRSYALIPGLDVLRVAQTFTNYGTSNITLRCFDTVDPDWLSNNVTFYNMSAHRYTLSTAAGPIQIARGILTNDNTTVLLGATDPAAVLAACMTSYFGIQNSTNLNTFFAEGGADSAGAIVDDSLDIGREMTIAPGAGTSFVYYQSIATGASAAESSLSNAIGAFPPVFQSSGQTNGVLSLEWSAIPDQNYQLQYKETLAQTNWLNTGAPIVAGGSTITTTDSVTAATQRFYRLVLGSPNSE